MSILCDLGETHDHCDVPRQGILNITANVDSMQYREARMESGNTYKFILCEASVL
jgi:hypothetical protein